MDDEILNVPFKKSKGEYMCSENVASMYLAYFGVDITPEELHQRGCFSIDTIAKCLTEELNTEYSLINIKKKITAKDLKNLIKIIIDVGYPIISSVVPNSNMEAFTKQIEKPLESFYHTILIVGYKKRSKLMYIHDQRPFEMLDMDTFYTISTRTQYTFVLGRGQGVSFTQEYIIKK